MDVIKQISRVVSSLFEWKENEKDVELRRSCAIRSEVSYKLRYVRTNSSLFQEELDSATRRVKKKALTRDACHSDSGHVLVSIERVVAQIVDLISPAVRALSSGSKLYANA